MTHAYEHTLKMVEGRREVFVDGVEVRLSHKEYELLALLRSSRNILSRKELLKYVWGLDSTLDIDTRTVDQHVCRIRRKIKVPFIITVPNHGYKFAI